MADILAETHSHPFDSFIQLNPVSHVYSVKKGGDREFISVTKWVESLFPSFDPDLIITKMMASPRWPQSPYFGKTRQAIKTQWAITGQKAARAGTAFHHTIEQLDFENEIGKHLTPYRTEWKVWDKELGIAGTVDMLFENADKTLSLYDWKRCKQIKKENAWETATPGCISHLPNTNYWHYALQLNMYKFILEKNYDKQVKEMFLVCCHPINENQSFIRMEVPTLVQEMNDLVALRLQNIQ